MPKTYILNNEEFMWVTPTPWMMNSMLLREIVQSQDKQLVVSLKTGVLTSHKYPKVEKKIPEDTVIYYHYNEDTYVKLSHDLNEARGRVFGIWKEGTIEIKGRGVMITVVGNMANFDRALNTLYSDLAV